MSHICECGHTEDDHVGGPKNECCDECSCTRYVAKAPGPTDEHMRSNPLSLEDLRKTVRSAHAFWRMPLRCKEHDSGLDVEVFSNGTIETHCRECKQLLGVLLLARVTPPAGEP